ncbi:hypothetical protein GQ43DRAFT_443825 [Delitschia confertaspora ATCC 74209]|uniref:Protein kinase domain-containing protein n=1 Tax=Delitschia confertaspora ATCC 74209 TaxID=1513339 RepID=A0A9P4MVD1_9PLEO|nr:hypothetical protein GQ43DRAFT_443825 [Delitschia confertaspora ATCC 74209]
MPASAPKLSKTSSSTLESAFSRLPRPQRVLDLNVPTEALQGQKHIRPARQAQYDVTVYNPSRTGLTYAAPEIPELSQRGTLGADATPPAEYSGKWMTLGTFGQGGTEWIVRMHKEQSGLVMVRKLRNLDGLRERKMLEQIEHPNIVSINHALREGDLLCVGINYCRITLGEILHTHVRLEERQIQYIAQSVFRALAYLKTLGITHHRVGLDTLRIAPTDLRIVLSNFEHATKDTIPLNSDLTDLGFVLLECMEGRRQVNFERDINFIKEQRAMNKVFGLSEPERWSGCKQLIDFLDDLFNDTRLALTKIAKPHRFVCANVDGECMRGYVELVSLECFTLWVAEN